VTDPYPMIKEFGAGATTCPNGHQQGTGCAVCSAAVVAVRYGRTIPRLTDGTPNMISLGTTMGALHRKAQPSSRHGLSLKPGQMCSGGYWCAYCAYLWLKTVSVPVAYGPLTPDQIIAQLKAKHPIILPGDYWQVPVVSASSFNSTTPARGRVQRSFSGRPFGHMVTAWEILPNGLVAVSDPDFGSYAGAPVPPHSLWTQEALLDFWRGLGWYPCYLITAPPSLDEQGQPKPPTPLPGVKYKYGGRPTSRGSYVIPAGVHIRSRPFLQSGNIQKTTSKNTTFAAAQATYAGTEVGGSTLWLGTRDGTRWVLKDLTKLVGHTTGKEEIQ
jgi:hypothetical protein